MKWMRDTSRHSKSRLIGMLIAFILFGGVCIYGYAYFKTQMDSAKESDVKDNLTMDEMKNKVNPENTDKFAFLGKSTPETQNPPQEQSDFLKKIDSDSEVRKQLYLAYGHFHGLIGFNNAEKYTTADWKEEIKFNYMQPSYYEKMSELISNEGAQRDLIQVAKLIRYARQGIIEDGIPNPDVMSALTYAFHIVNDVQVWVLPEGGEDTKVRVTFGASFALDKHVEADKIENWIEAHISNKS